MTVITSKVAMTRALARSGVGQSRSRTIKSNNVRPAAVTIAYDWIRPFWSDARRSRPTNRGIQATSRTRPSMR